MIPLIENHPKYRRGVTEAQAAQRALDDTVDGLKTWVIKALADTGIAEGCYVRYRFAFHQDLRYAKITDIVLSPDPEEACGFCVRITGRQVVDVRLDKGASVRLGKVVHLKEADTWEAISRDDVLKASFSPPREVAEIECPVILE